MFIPRILNLKEHLKEKSVLLLGARRTGKSFFIEHQIEADCVVNLLSAETFKMLSFDPGLLSTFWKTSDRLIAIDEVQKLPVLMDEIHSLIEHKKNLRFLLTGSSAKKIKKTHTSLMAGRLRQLHFLPFIYQEVKDRQFNLDKFLLFGGLPPVFLSTNPWEELKDYSGTYLKEEIQESAWVKKIENYSRFLDFAAKTSGELLNFKSLSQDAFIPPRTIRDYYDLLEETLIGYTLRPFKKKGSRKEVSTSKFYFFDLGVLNSLTKRKTLLAGTDYGRLFEHFIFLELKAFQLINRADWDLTFWRTHTQHEVDFVLGEGEIAIEVKASKKIQEKHLIGLAQMGKDHKIKKKIVICQEKVKRQMGEVWIYPWNIFLDELWNGLIIDV